jgi:hypothetical protein
MCTAAAAKGSGEQHASNSAPAPRSQRYYIVVASAVFTLRLLAMAAFAPYLFLWLESNGFDTHSRGVLGALSGLARFFSPMAVGALADWSGRRKLIFVAGTLGNAAAIAALPLVPRSFGAQAVLLALGGLVEPGSLVDAFVMRSLAWAGVSSAAARARAFGALSWAAAAPLFGALSTTYGLPTLFWAYCALNVFVAAPVILLLPIDAAYAAVSACAVPADATTPAITATTATTATTTTTATTATTIAVAASGDIATTTAAPPPTTPPPAAPLSFAQRARGALCGHETRSVQLRFCVPMVALVGFQMGIGFAWGFIYLKQGLHASGLLIGCSLTFQAAIEVPLLLRGLQPHASRLQPYASSLQPRAIQPATPRLQVPLFRISAWLIGAFGGVRPALLTTSLAGAIRMAGWWALLTAVLAVALLTMAVLTVAVLTVAVLTVALLSLPWMCLPGGPRRRLSPCCLSRRAMAGPSLLPTRA